MIKKLLKKIGKGIKTGLKSVGKAFKKVFKGVGKFFGKLGPIGMLAMMIMMPQLGAWWGQFGQWAGTLGKGFGTVMRGLHWAGAKVGQAYSTITGGIKRVLNVVTGGSWAAAGTAEYQAGLSDKFANWMSGQLDKGREFLGLETQQNRAFTQNLEKLDPTHANFDQVEYDKFINAPTGQELGKTLHSRGLTYDDIVGNPDLATQLGNEFGYIKDAEGYVYSFDDLNASTLGEIQSGSKPFRAIGQVGKGFDLSQTGTPNTWKLRGQEGWIEPPKFGEVPKDYRSKRWSGQVGRKATVPKVSEGAGVAATKSELSKLEKWGLGVSTAGGAVSLLQTAAGYGDDSISGGGLGPAEAALIPYESANVDWVNQGYAGQPLYGIGNTNYFQSLVDYSNTDPYYQYLTRLTA